MIKLTLPEKAIAVPLIGLFLAWVFMLAGMIIDIYTTPWPRYTSTGSLVDTPEPIRFAPYFFLLAVAAIALSALFGQRQALRSRLELGQEHQMSRAAHRFANLMVWLGLGLGAVFAIGNFLSAFGGGMGQPRGELYVRLISIYLPILLVTALEIFVIVKSFVSRPDLAGQGKNGQINPEVRKALALGYSWPIVSTAVAIVLGLIIYDISRTNLDTWIWVVVLSIVISGIIAGTRFSRVASHEEAPIPMMQRMRKSLAAGASNLNFVLSVVFGAVVSIIAVTATGGAVQKLRSWSYIDGVEKIDYSGMDWNWYLSDLAPAKVLVLLVVIGTYLTITLRNRETDKPSAIAA